MIYTIKISDNLLIMQYYKIDRSIYI